MGLRLLPPCTDLPLVLLLTLAFVVFPGVAPRAATYWIGFGDSTVTSPTPLTGSRSVNVPPSTFDEYLAAGAGALSIDQSLTTVFEGVGSSAGASRNWVMAQTEDFVISGPGGGSVPATMYFTATFELDGSNGYGDQSNRSEIHVAVSSNWLFVGGSGYAESGNLSSAGAGAFAGYAGGAATFIVAVSGMAPVGAPISFTPWLEARCYTYGNAAVSPGIRRVHAGDGATVPRAGLRIGNLEGLVMDLPAGYTVNSPSWNVVDNALPLVASAPGVDGAGPALTVSPNPSGDVSRIAYSLGSEREVELAVHDVTGRLVRTLLAGRAPAGPGSRSWDGRNDAGAPVGAGVYWVVLRSGPQSEVARVVRVR